MSIDASETSSKSNRHPDEKIPATRATGLGLQITGLVLPGLVLMPTVVFRSAGQAESILLWAVCASIIVCGVVTILQAIRIGRVGAGYILIAGTSGASIAVCSSALSEGGPALLAILMLLLSLFQFLFATRLSLFRQVLTPTVMGTVIMLTPVTVMPIIFDQMNNVPAGSPAVAGPLSAFATLIVVAIIVLKARATLRVWAPAIGIIVGTIVAAFFGLYDFSRVVEASWVGLPQSPMAKLQSRIRTSVLESSSSISVYFHSLHDPDDKRFRCCPACILACASGG